MQVHHFMNMETITVLWHLINKHNQLPGLLYVVKTSVYAEALEQRYIYKVTGSRELILWTDPFRTGSGYETST